MAPYIRVPVLKVTPGIYQSRVDSITINITTSVTLTADSDFKYLANFTSLTDLVRSQMPLDRPDELTAVSGNQIATSFIFTLVVVNS